MLLSKQQGPRPWGQTDRKQNRLTENNMVPNWVQLKTFPPSPALRNCPAEWRTPINHSNGHELKDWEHPLELEDSLGVCLLPWGLSSWGARIPSMTSRVQEGPLPEGDKGEHTGGRGPRPDGRTSLAFHGCRQFLRSSLVLGMGEPHRRGGSQESRIPLHPSQHLCHLHRPHRSLNSQR